MKASLTTTDNLKIPLNPPFSKGEIRHVPLFGKEGSGEILKWIAVLLITVSFLFPLISIAAAAEKGTEEELKERIAITNKKRVTPKEIKRFTDQVKAYFFETVPDDVIESAMKELTPGEALAAIVITNLSKKPGKDIIKMKKDGKSWTEIVNASGLKMKDVVKEVKEFQKTSGCA
ncbi:MAG: hypothetical protein HY808_00080 [Nitrospirae bacterium]|nr:hypothetical protein [Nitrospirota bacterium]